MKQSFLLQSGPLARSLLAMFAITAIAFSNSLSAQLWQIAPTSKITAGDAANDSSNLPKISGNGRYIAYQSGATNLRAGQIDAKETDVFLFDRQSNTTALVSHSASDPFRSSAPGFSELRAISSGGTVVLFDSTAPQLIPGESTGFVRNVFLYDRVTNSNYLLSHAAGSTTRSNGECRAKAMDENGQGIVMACTSTDLQAGITDTNGGHDLYLSQLGANNAILISHSASSLTTTANSGVDAFAGAVRLSSDRRWLAFVSNATNHVLNQVDNNNANDVFLYDANSGEIRLVSHLPGNAGSTAASAAHLVGMTGNYVYFNSAANNLAAGVSDTNNANDVFEYDITTANVRLVTHAAGIPSLAANGASTAIFSETALDQLLIETTASNIKAGLSGSLTKDVLFWTRNNNSFALVSHTVGDFNNGNVNQRINAPARALAMDKLGTTVVFDTTATDVTAGFIAQSISTNNAYRYTTFTAANQLITYHQPQSNVGADAAVDAISISDGGIYLAYASRASDLSTSLDGNGLSDIYLFTSGVNTSTLVSKAAFAQNASVAGGSTSPVAMTADGRFTLQDSRAYNLSFGQVESNQIAAIDSDVFVFDAQTNVHTLISYAIDGLTPYFNAPANGASKARAISGDGQQVLYQSAATNLVPLQIDGNAKDDVFLNESGATTLVSHASGAPLSSANNLSNAIALSSDGRFVLFESLATNLLSGVTDSNANFDVFLYDRSTRSTQLVSRSIGATTTGNGVSRGYGLTADGRFALFVSNATNLINGFVNNNGSGDDVFVFDRVTNFITLISRLPSSAQAGANGSSLPVSINAEGSRVLFYSLATNLDPAITDSNGATDVFLHDAFSSPRVRMLSRSYTGLQSANASSTAVALSGNGQYALYRSFASDLVANLSDGNGVADTYLYDFNSNSTRLFSRSAVAASTTSNRAWGGLSINHDGSRITIETLASDVIDDINTGAFFSQIYQYDRVTQSNSLISHQRAVASAVANNNSSGAVMSANGNRIAFASNSTNLFDWYDEKGLQDSFIANRITSITINTNINGIGTASPSEPQTVAIGAQVVMTLTPGPGQRIESVNGCDGSLSFNTYITGAASADCTINVVFAPLQLNLSYRSDSNGSVEGSSDQIVSYGASGTPVTAQPNVGFQFSSWNDGHGSITRTDNNVMANLLVTAQFSVRRYQLFYQASPNGTINGQAVQIQSVSHGASGAPVTATANSGYRFVRWSDGYASAPRTDFNVLQNINVSAEFSVQQ
jgi:hypothetical protein